MYFHFRLAAKCTFHSGSAGHLVSRRRFMAHPTCPPTPRISVRISIATPPTHAPHSLARAISSLSSPSSSSSTPGPARCVLRGTPLAAPGRHPPAPPPPRPPPPTAPHVCGRLGRVWRAPETSDACGRGGPVGGGRCGRGALRDRAGAARRQVRSGRTVPPRWRAAQRPQCAATTCSKSSVLETRMLAYGVCCFRSIRPCVQR